MDLAITAQAYQTQRPTVFGHIHGTSVSFQQNNVFFYIWLM